MHAHERRHGRRRIAQTTYALPPLPLSFFAASAAASSSSVGGLGTKSAGVGTCGGGELRSG
jgi:hypothetical protein